MERPTESLCGKGCRMPHHGPLRPERPFCGSDTAERPRPPGRGRLGLSLLVGARSAVPIAPPVQGPRATGGPNIVTACMRAGHDRAPPRRELYYRGGRAPGSDWTW